MMSGPKKTGHNDSISVHGDKCKHTVCLIGKTLPYVSFVNIN